MMLTTLFFILTLAPQSPGSSPAVIDVPSLFGQTMTQLKETFPIQPIQSPNWSAGENIEITDWQGWHKIIFHFNGNGRLAALDLVFSETLRPAKAVTLCQNKLGITLESQNRVEAPILLAYRNMGSPIRTVNLINQSDRQDWQNGIDNIYVQFDIGWSD